MVQIKLFYDNVVVDVQCYAMLHNVVQCGALCACERKRKSVNIVDILGLFRITKCETLGPSENTENPDLLGLGRFVPLQRLWA